MSVKAAVGEVLIDVGRVKADVLRWPSARKSLHTVPTRESSALLAAPFAALAPPFLPSALPGRS